MAKETEARLQEIGIVLPELPAVGGNYLPAKTVGHIVYLAGVISTNSDGVITGTVGIDRTVDEGRWAFSEVHAYLLCSVAMNLHLSQVVNEPMFTVSAEMPKHVLPGRKLF